MSPPYTRNALPLDCWRQVAYWRDALRPDTFRRSWPGGVVEDVQHGGAAGAQRPTLRTLSTMAAQGLDQEPIRMPSRSGLFEAESARFQDLLERARTAARSVGPDLVALWLYGSVARTGRTATSTWPLVVAAARPVADHPDRRQQFADAFRDEMASFSRRSVFSPLARGPRHRRRRQALVRTRPMMDERADGCAASYREPSGATAARVAQPPRRSPKTAGRRVVDR